MRQFSVAALVTTVLVGGIILLAPWRPPWEAWSPATCMPDWCFCELPRDLFTRQPVNAISSLAFCLVAAAVLLLSSRPGSTPTAARARICEPTYTVVFAVATFLIGIGSAFYHVSLTFVGQTADVLGMYLLATFIVLYQVARYTTITNRTALWSYVLGNAALLGVLIAMPAARRYIFAILIIAVLAAEFAVRSRRLVNAASRHLFNAILALAVGFTFWIADITRTGCYPASWVQGHGIWHILGAFATLQIFLYFRSETTERQQ